MPRHPGPTLSRSSAWRLRCPSRGDDALGPLLLERIEAPALSGVEALTDFQLQVEHATDLVGRRMVLFVDADVSAPAPYSFSRLAPRRDASYTSHEMSPAAVLEVYRELYGEPPPAYLLGIRGERFELGEPLSATAAAHLAAAHELVRALCAHPACEQWEQFLISSRQDPSLS